MIWLQFSCCGILCAPLRTKIGPHLPIKFAEDPRDELNQRQAAADRGCVAKIKKGACNSGIYNKTNLLRLKEVVLYIYTTDIIAKCFLFWRWEIYIRKKSLFCLLCIRGRWVYLLQLLALFFCFFFSPSHITLAYTWKTSIRSSGGVDLFFLFFPDYYRHPLLLIFPFLSL